MEELCTYSGPVDAAPVRHRPASPIRSRILASSAEMERVFELIEQVAPTRATVLITGETGTGKELVARAVHDLSRRRVKPFTPIHCAAIPETLLESELFGHTKGSFTGASTSRRGLFEEADGGTVFLDEVGTIPLPTQVKLLRVLQTKTIQRIGSSSPVPVDFRLVAATNADLALEVKAGRFREDLFYRLNVFPLHVPPLRERNGDVPLLAQHFCRRFAAEHAVAAPQIPQAILDRMMRYSWPGNVRELENTIERAVILSAGRGALYLDLPSGDGPVMEDLLLTRAAQERWGIERLEREYILRVLESTGGHRTEAAVLLGIDRRTLDRKLERYRARGLFPH